MTRSFFDDESMFLYDFKTYRILDANQYALDKYGYSIDEFREMKITDLGEQIRITSGSENGSRKLNPQSIWKQYTRDGESFFIQYTSHLMTYSGQPVKLAIAHDITDDLEVMKKKPHLFPRIEIHTANLPLAMIEWDDQFRIRDWLGKASDIFGWEYSDVYGKNMFDTGMIPEESKDTVKKVLQDCIEKRLPYFDSEMEALTNTGERIYCSWHHSAVYAEDNSLLAIYSMVDDVTARKKAEEKVHQSLKEKEVLLAEIHHRVKNNLAVITGLLELQGMNTDNPDAKSVLKDSQMRVISMALIHEKLYQSENLSRIKFNTYIRELTSVIGKTHTIGKKRISFKIDAEAIRLPITQAIPCGLLLNEIVTNSLKHAFPNQKKGLISISFKRINGTLRFDIGDNGIGLPNDFNKLKDQSLGMTLIHTLVQQLKAGVEIDTTRGTTYSVQFKYNGKAVTGYTL